MTLQQDTIISEETMEQHYLYAIRTSQEASWSATLHIRSHEVPFKIDMGAEITAISDKVYKDINQPTLQRLRKFQDTTQIFVIKNLKHNLLGLPAITALDLAARLDSYGTKLFLVCVPRAWQPGRAINNQASGELHSIWPRAIPLPLLSKVQTELTKMEAQGVISKGQPVNTMVHRNGCSTQEVWSNQNMCGPQAS